MLLQAWLSESQAHHGEVNALLAVSWYEIKTLEGTMRTHGELAL